MDRNTALGAAAGVVLAVVGAVSALFLTIGQPADAATDDGASVEYVDQYGNPVAAPLAPDESTTPQVVLVNPDGTLVDTVTSDPMATAGYGEEAEGEEYEDEDDYEDGDHAEGEEYPEGDEHEGDEYPEGEHMEDEHAEGDEYPEDDEDDEDGEDEEEEDDD